MRMSIVAVFVLVPLVAGCGGSGSSAQSGGGVPLEGECISTEPVSARASSGGTVVFSVIPEGLPAGAEIVEVEPCSTVVRAACAAGESPLYYVPCEAVGPGVCDEGVLFWPACRDTGRCPAGDDPTLVWSGIGECPRGGPEAVTVSTTVDCGDGTQMEREATIVIVLPGDCDEDGLVSADEVDVVIRAVFDTRGPQCGADLNLDGKVTPDELQKVVAFAIRSEQTGDPCPSVEGPR